MATKFSVGIASHETIRFLTLKQLKISKILRYWHQLCDVPIAECFQTGLEKNIFGRLLGPTQLLTPLYSQPILRIYAPMNGMNRRTKMEFVPERGKHQVRDHQRGALGHQVSRKDHEGRLRACSKIKLAWSISLQLTNINTKICEGKLSQIII